MKDHKEISQLILGLITKVFLPCLPIFIERIVVFLVPGINSPFPNRDIIIIAFLVPIVWVVNIDNSVLLISCVIFIVFACIPFIVSLISPSEKVYWSGFILALTSIIFFTTYDIRLYLKKKSITRVKDVEDINL